jgi:hypothetical protein
MLRRTHADGVASGLIEEQHRLQSEVLENLVDEGCEGLCDFDRSDRSEAEGPGAVQFLPERMRHFAAYELGLVVLGALVPRGALEGRV